MAGWNQIRSALNRILISPFTIFGLTLNMDTDIFNAKYKKDLSDSYFYWDVYSIQLKVHIVKFEIHEYNFTAKFIDKQSEIKSQHTFKYF